MQGEAIAHRSAGHLFGWQARFKQRPTTGSASDAATTLAADHGLTIWDAMILTVADEAGCRLLLSEDMQHGFTWRGVTIVNPFTSDLYPLLMAAQAPTP